MVVKSALLSCHPVISFNSAHRAALSHVIYFLITFTHSETLIIWLLVTFINISVHLELYLAAFTPEHKQSGWTCFNNTKVQRSKGPVTLSLRTQFMSM